MVQCACGLTYPALTYEWRGRQPAPRRHFQQRLRLRSCGGLPASAPAPTATSSWRPLPLRQLQGWWCRRTDLEPCQQLVATQQQEQGRWVMPSPCISSTRSLTTPGPCRCRCLHHQARCRQLPQRPRRGCMVIVRNRAAGCLRAACLSRGWNACSHTVRKWDDQGVGLAVAPV